MMTMEGRAARCEAVIRRIPTETARLNQIYEVTAADLLEMSENERAEVLRQLRFSKGFADVLRTTRTQLKGIVERRRVVSGSISDFEVKIWEVEKLLRKDREYRQQQQQLAQNLPAAAQIHQIPPPMEVGGQENEEDPLPGEGVSVFGLWKVICIFFLIFFLATAYLIGQ